MRKFKEPFFIVVFAFVAYRSAIHLINHFVLIKSQGFSFFSVTDMLILLAVIVVAALIMIRTFYLMKYRWEKARENKKTRVKVETNYYPDLKTQTRSVSAIGRKD